MKKFALVLFAVFVCMMSYAQETFVSGGINRSMIVYAPQNLGKNRPLLISMHGMNQDANYQRNQANYEAVADTAKFVVVYPNGIDKGWDLGSDKDINFILDIIDEMSKRYSIDQNRVYLSGFSMGGMMTYYAATKIADKIAAFAPCSGYPMGGPNTQSSRPIPILHVHGTSDDVCVYSNVQTHLNAWVSRNHCKTTPRVEKPKSGPSNTTAEMIRYTDGDNGVEVAHLKMPGKGHWHSNDPAVAMTNIEVWNFLSRWSLTPGPAMSKVTPEDGSFDMSAEDNRTFVVEFDKPVDCGRIKASMSEGTSSITLSVAENGYSQTVTMNIPSKSTPKNAEYRLMIKDIYGEDGSQSAAEYLHYTYGIVETGETLHIDTLLHEQDWYAMQEAIGEGIPYGWNRVNSNADSRDEKTSGMANTGGCRLKYFEQGGDMDAGFYFSSREYSQATFTYGETSPYLLNLTRGFYVVSFRSTYWNAGAQNNHVTFNMNVIRASNGSSVFAASSLTPTGCLSENTSQQVSRSKLHEVEFETLYNGNHLLQFSIAAGWDGIILGAPTISRRPSQAELYKGEFLRTLACAQRLFQKLQNLNIPDYAGQIAVLQSTIAQYESFVSILPSAYVEACQALRDAMSLVEGLALSSAVRQESTIEPMYDVLGRPVITPVQSGIYLQGGRKIVRVNNE